MSLLCLSGRYDQLYTYATFAVVLSYTATGLALFFFRFRRPDRPRPYRCWGYPFVPGLFVATSILLAVNLGSRSRRSRVSRSSCSASRSTSGCAKARRETTARLLFCCFWRDPRPALDLLRPRSLGLLTGGVGARIREATLALLPEECSGLLREITRTPHPCRDRRKQESRRSGPARRVLGRQVEEPPTTSFSAPDGAWRLGESGIRLAGPKNRSNQIRHRAGPSRRPGAHIRVGGWKPRSSTPAWRRADYDRRRDRISARGRIALVGISAAVTRAKSLEAEKRGVGAVVYRSNRQRLSAPHDRTSPRTCSGARSCMTSRFPEIRSRPAGPPSPELEESRRANRRFFRRFP